MARIKIKDLPPDVKVSKEQMRKVHGGGYIGKDVLLFDLATIWAGDIYREGRVGPTPPTPPDRLRSTLPK